MNRFPALRTTTTNFKQIKKREKEKNLNDDTRVGISLTGFSYVSFPIGSCSFPVTIGYVFHIPATVVVK